MCLGESNGERMWGWKEEAKKTTSKLAAANYDEEAFSDDEDKYLCKLV